MSDDGLSPPRSLPIEVRAVGVLLALEIAAGLWFSLNWPPGMSVFLSQLPAFGAVGVVWGFLPHEPKDAFGAWFAERLRRPAVWITISALLVSAVVASCFVNTVAVVGSPDDPTWIYQHTGAPETALNAAIPDAERKRLRRGSDALYFFTLTSPVGRSIWMSSPSRLTPDAVRVMPWKPTTFRYPEDFETPVVLSALPGSKALLDVKSAAPLRLLVVEAGTGDTLALTTIDAAGAMLFAFLPTSIPDSIPLAWRNESTRFDSSTAQQVMQLWKAQAGARSVRRPLRVNERLRVSALDASGTAVWTQEVILRGANSTILVAP